jgi:hypothetical protein
MKHIAVFGFFFVWCFASNAQSFLSEHAQISLLTTYPTDNEVFTVYGHTSIRVRDSIVPNQKMDYVFNYGMFDQSIPNFVYRFAKGETDYWLACYDYELFAVDRQLQTSSVHEQVLNLTQNEKQNLWQALIINAQPENRVYRYDFFFDNCATRPAILIEQSVNGKIIYETPPPEVSFRDLINFCTRNKPWQTFGCDLVLGIPTDRIVTLQESFFIPEYLQNAFSNAQIINPDGTKRPLMAAEYMLIERIDDDDIEKTFFTPLLCSLILFAIIVLITWFEWRRKKYFRLVDCLLFLIAGIAGCILFFLCFISEHPSIWPNISVVWLHPFHLAAIVLFSVKKWNKAAYYYHFTNFVALLLMSFAWIFIPQHLNMAFIPLIATLLLRSGYRIVNSE